MSEQATLIGGKIRFECAECKHHIAVAPVLAGKKGKCPKCGHVNHVPQLASDPEPEIEEIALEEVPLEEAPAESSGKAPKRQIQQHGFGPAKAKDNRATGDQYIKTFVTKLRTELDDPVHGAPNCIAKVDEDMNAWLAQNPNYEVVNITQSYGTMMDKKGDEFVLFVRLCVRRNPDADG